jgi:Ca-activated chloride channel family protein
MSLSVTPDRPLIRTGARSRRYVRVELGAPEAPPNRNHLPVNVALVLDRSGSMAGGKIGMARAAVLRAIRILRPQDRFSVVAYDNEIDVVMPSSPATPEARAEAERRVRDLQPGGATDLCGGWLRGCEQVGLHLAADGVDRCLLLTDGLVNHGIVDPVEIVAHAAALRERGVATSTFGVGADFDETLLRRMSQAGGGGFYFIEDPAQIPDFLAGEVGDALEVVAPRAALMVEAGEKVVVGSLNAFPCRRDGSSWRVELGSLLRGQSLDPVLALTFPEGTLGSAHAVTVSLVDRSRTLETCASVVVRFPSRVDPVRTYERCASVVFRYARDEEVNAQPRERSVERRVAALYAARASQEALELNRAGDFEAARRALEVCRRAIVQYAGDDAEIRAILRDLDGRASRYGVDMTSLSRKAEYTGTIASLTLRPTMPGTIGW